MATRESENFYRLASLLLDIGTAAIRKLFLKYATSPPTVNVAQFLLQAQNTINRLHSRKIIGAAQLALLQPPPGQIQEPETWDISLLCILLKNICPITPPERTEIETLRTARNKIYGHRENACLTDTDFTVQWAAIESSIKAIARYCNDPVFENQLMQYIQRVKSGPLDLVGITDIFTRWFKTERSLQEELENVTDTIKDVSAMVKDAVSMPKVTDPVFENLKDQTRTLLEYKCSQPFVPTTQYSDAKSLLEQTGSVTISGKPGEGKTVTAYRLIESMEITGRCVCLYDYTQWDHIDIDEVDVVLLDGVFGKHQLEARKLEGWGPIFKILDMYIKASKLKVIMTCRKNVLLEATKTNTDLSESSLIKNMIELSSSELKSGEMQDLIELLLDFYKRDKSVIDVRKCCEIYKADIGFPYCCFLFAVDKSLFAMRERFFERPYQFFKENLCAMSREVKASLLFLFYMQGTCLEKDLKPSIKRPTTGTENLLEKISDLVGISDGAISLQTVRDILLELSGIYVTYLNKTFNFAHNVVYECIALNHSEKYPEEVIESCTWDFIIGCVVASKTDNEAKLTINCDLYELLSIRFIRETLGDRKNGSAKFYDIRNHNVIQTKDVCESFYLTLFKQGKLQQFLMEEMDGHQSGFLYRYLNSKQVGQNIYIVEEVIPYLKCKCSVEDFLPCWKCQVKNDSVRGVCFGGDSLSFSLLLKENIKLTTHNIIDASMGGDADLMKLLISTLRSRGNFKPEEATKALVIAKKSRNSILYSTLRSEGIGVMPQCVFDAVDLKNFEITKHFVCELKATAMWNTTDFWLQSALAKSIRYENDDISNYLRKEGLSFHRGCLLSAVKSRKLSKVKEVVEGMKTTGTWQAADASFETELKGLLSMMPTGRSLQLNFRTLADVGISEAIVEANCLEDKSIYNFLRDEGVQLTMETLPFVVATKNLDLVKGVVDDIKCQGKWNPEMKACAEAILKAMRQGSQDIFDYLIEQGAKCTMDILPGLLIEQNITKSDVKEAVELIKQFGNWMPNCVPMQTALVHAYKNNQSIFEYFIQCGASVNTVTLLTAVIGQDLDTVQMCLQILKSKSDWDPSDQVLNMCLQMSMLASPEIHSLLQAAGIGYSTNSLVQAAAKNDQCAMMMTINELKDRHLWKPDTDSNITKSLDLVCHHNSILMFNVLQKKGAKLSVSGVFNLIKNCKSLLYSIGPEYRKPVKPVPLLSAMTVASIAERFLVAAVRQTSTLSYIIMIHALEEVGKLQGDDPLLRDAMEAAVDSGSALAYNVIADTGTKVSEHTVLKILLKVQKELVIEAPERLLTKLYRECLMQCLLACIRNGNIQILEVAISLMKQNVLWCQNDQRIIQAIKLTPEVGRTKTVQLLIENKLIQ